MRILAIGDLHGRIPRGLKKFVKKEKPDLIVSQGDFCAFYERKIWFKHCYAKDVDLHEVIGKEKAKKYVKRDIDAGKKVFSYIKSINLPFYSVTGNEDPSKYNQIGQEKSRWDVYNKPFILRKHLLDFVAKKFNDYILIGYPRSSYPGLPTQHLRKKYKEKSLAKNVRDYKRYKKLLDKLFKKYKKNKIIFISHNCPYMSKLDKLGPKAHKLARGRHYGDVLTKNVIKEYQPFLCVCGHMHENQGKTKIGKTLVVNAGYGRIGQAAVIDINKTIKVRLVKI